MKKIICLAIGAFFAFSTMYVEGMKEQSTKDFIAAQKRLNKQERLDGKLKYPNQDRRKKNSFDEDNAVAEVVNNWNAELKETMLTILTMVESMDKSMSPGAVDEVLYSGVMKLPRQVVRTIYTMNPGQLAELLRLLKIWQQEYQPGAEGSEYSADGSYHGLTLYRPTVYKPKEKTD